MSIVFFENFKAFSYFPPSRRILALKTAAVLSPLPFAERDKNRSVGAENRKDLRSQVNYDPAYLEIVDRREDFQTIRVLNF